MNEIPNPATETFDVPEATTEYKSYVLTVVRKFRPGYEYDYTYGSRTPNPTTDHIVVEPWEVWECAANGKVWYDNRSAKSAQDAVARAKRAIDRLEADEEIYPSLQVYVGRVQVELGPAAKGPDGKLRKPVISTNVTLAIDPQVGDHVVAYSRGYWRRGVVAKVGRKNAEMAYVTAVNGQITRKAIALDSLYKEVVA
jgi:hypothetical protein